MRNASSGYPDNASPYSFYDLEADMAITYVYKNNLYVNITTLNTCRCDFSAREPFHSEQFTNMLLDHEPTLQEIIAEVSSHNLSNFGEIVFAGPGEPACRLFDMLETCKKIREICQTPIRVNTNGHASLILAEDTAPMFRGLVDCMHISLNAADPDTYMKMCHPRFGENAFTGVVKFAREAVKYLPKVAVTAPRGILPETDYERISMIAADIGAAFILR